MKVDREIKAAKAGVPEELTLIYRVNSAATPVPPHLRPLSKAEYTAKVAKAERMALREANRILGVKTRKALRMYRAAADAGVLENWGIGRRGSRWLVYGHFGEERIEVSIRFYHDKRVLQLTRRFSLGVCKMSPGAVSKVRALCPEALLIFKEMGVVCAAEK